MEAYQFSDARYQPRNLAVPTSVGTLCKDGKDGKSGAQLSFPDRDSYCTEYGHSNTSTVKLTPPSQSSSYQATQASKASWRRGTWLLIWSLLSSGAERIMW
jgi:hypothetical protein